MNTHCCADEHSFENFSSRDYFLQADHPESGFFFEDKARVFSALKFEIGTQSLQTGINLAI